MSDEKVCYLCKKPDRGRKEDPKGHSMLMPVGENKQDICWDCFAANKTELEPIVDKNLDELVKEEGLDLLRRMLG